MNRGRSVMVLLTGGTIGQRGAAGGAVPDADSTVGLVTGNAPAGITLRTVQAMERNSPDMSPGDWTVLAQLVAQGLSDGADGVVILHGTDTLAYTAAALSFALQGVDRPVVLTGSMIPGSAPGSDAAANLRAAYAVAASPLPGVWVVFSSPGAAAGTKAGADILRGTRVLKVRTADPAAFSSAAGRPPGRVADGKVDLPSLPRRPARWRPAATARFNEEVDLIKITPMTTSSRLRGQLRGLAGVVIEGFGAGHVRAPHVQVLRDFDGPVVISTQVLTDAERLGTYASDRLLTDLPQVIRGGPMTSVAALVKLSWALGQALDPREIMSTELAGEFGAIGSSVESASGIAPAGGRRTE